MLKITALATFVLLATSASAAERKIVVVSGCTSGSLEGCEFLDSPLRRYALHVKPPRPGLTRGVTVIGTIEDGPGVCLFAPTIRVQKWGYNRLHCPK